jgi:hypothetical protein
MPNKDMEQLSEVLETVTAKVPNLIRETMNSLYSPESGANMGKAVGSFYKELVEAGIPQDEALQMAKDYMLSLKDTIKFNN